MDDRLVLRVMNNLWENGIQSDYDLFMNANDAIDYCQLYKIPYLIIIKDEHLIKVKDINDKHEEEVSSESVVTFLLKILNESTKSVEMMAPIKVIMNQKYKKFMNDKVLTKIKSLHSIPVLVVDVSNNTFENIVKMNVKNENYKKEFIEDVSVIEHIRDYLLQHDMVWIYNWKLNCIDLYHNKFL